MELNGGRIFQQAQRTVSKAKREKRRKAKARPHSPERIIYLFLSKTGARRGLGSQRGHNLVCILVGSFWLLKKRLACRESRVEVRKPVRRL
jgi:hypothetical protein